MVVKRTQVFDEAAINAMAHAFAVALRKPGHQTPSTRKIDASQVRDKRSPVAAAIYRAVWAGDNPHAGDARSERPAPRGDPRIGAAGRHNAEDAERRVKAAGSHGAFRGDGRVERPAPQPMREGDPMPGMPGNAHGKGVRKVKPKPQTKPRFNQGRHDG